MSAHQFKAGDKVVCIDDAPLNTVGLDPDMGGLRVGEVYTIREIGPVSNLHPSRGRIAIKLAEIVRKSMSEYGGETGFLVSRFRPVQKRTTSIECFRALLNPTEHSPEDIEYARQIIEEIEDAAELNAALKSGRFP